MLKVVFNEDGSINELIVMESINQGSNNVNKVFASILGRSNEDYTCVGEFELPSGDLEELSGVVDSQEVGQSTLDGYTISLAESVTRQAGNLKLNLKLIDLQDNVLCTYQVTLKVNKTGYEPSTTHITEAQYNALLQSLNGYALNLDLENYYTKTEIDTKFEDYYTISQVQANYYDKDYIDTYLYTINQIESYYYDKTYINTYIYTKAAVDLLLAEKQKTLTAGAGISILEDGTISATTSLALAYYPSLQALPSVGALNTIYMIPSSQPAEPNNNYDEYIWDTTNTRYEKIGTISTQVDLSNYYNKQETDARYVQKTTAGTYSKVYVKSVSGVDTTMYADERVIEGAIVQRGASGQVFVPTTPTNNSHAASKEYVDAAIAGIHLYEHNIIMTASDDLYAAKIATTVITTSSSPIDTLAKLKNIVGTNRHPCSGSLIKQNTSTYSSKWYGSTDTFSISNDGTLLFVRAANTIGWDYDIGQIYVSSGYTSATFGSVSFETNSRQIM